MAPKISFRASPGNDIINDLALFTSHDHIINLDRATVGENRPVGVMQLPVSYIDVETWAGAELAKVAGVAPTELLELGGGSRSQPTT